MTKVTKTKTEEEKQNYDHKYIVITPKFPTMKNAKVLLIFTTYPFYTRFWIIRQNSRLKETLLL